MVVLALTGFVLGLAFSQVQLTFLAGQAVQLSALALLAAFCLLLLPGLLQLSRLLLAAVCDYFSYRHRLERKLWYGLNQHRRLRHLFQHQKTRMLYDNHQQRKKLLQQNSKSTVSL